MKKNELSLENTILISPVKAHHFFITLPPLKKSHLYNAITYALRPLYPGLPEKTYLDYKKLNVPKFDTPKFKFGSAHKLLEVYNNKYVIIAIDRKTNKKFKSQQKPIISSTFLLQELQNAKSTPKTSLPIKTSTNNQTSISILVTHEWTEAIYFENSIPVNKISCNTTRGLSRAEICQFIQENRKKNEPIFIYTHNISLHTKKAQQLENVITSKMLKKSEIFIEPKNIKNKLSQFITASILLVCFCGLTDLYLYMSLQKKTKQAQQLKTDYETIITQQKNENIPKAKDNLAITTQESKSRITTYQILNEFYAVKDNSWINSLILKENSFQFEAEGAQALKILEDLQDSPLFSDVYLHQVQPSTLQGEVFTITGQIKND